MPNGGSGVMSVLNTYKVKKIIGQARVLGTVKAAVIEGEPDCPTVVVSSVYETKPVHFISILTETLPGFREQTNIL